MGVLDVYKNRHNLLLKNRDLHRFLNRCSLYSPPGRLIRWNLDHVQSDILHSPSFKVALT
jgi:hypothetical protein